MASKSFVIVLFAAVVTISSSRMVSDDVEIDRSMDDDDSSPSAGPNPFYRHCFRTRYQCEQIPTARVAMANFICQQAELKFGKCAGSGFSCKRDMTKVTSGVTDSALHKFISMGVTSWGPDETCEVEERELDDDSDDSASRELSLTGAQDDGLESMEYPTLTAAQDRGLQSMGFPEDGPEDRFEDAPLVKPTAPGSRHKYGGRKMPTYTPTKRVIKDKGIMKQTKPSRAVGGMMPKDVDLGEEEEDGWFDFKNPLFRTCVSGRGKHATCTQIPSNRVVMANFLCKQQEIEWGTCKGKGFGCWEDRSKVTSGVSDSLLMKAISAGVTYWGPDEKCEEVPLNDPVASGSRGLMSGVEDIPDGSW